MLLTRSLEPFLGIVAHKTVSDQIMILCIVPSSEGANWIEVDDSLRYLQSGSHNQMKHQRSLKMVEYYLKCYYAY